jgi:hypothetical protein
LYSGEIPSFMKFFPCFTNTARVLPENSAGYANKKKLNAYSPWICGADAGENVWCYLILNQVVEKTTGNHSFCRKCGIEITQQCR